MPRFIVCFTLCQYSWQHHKHYTNNYQYLRNCKKQRFCFDSGMNIFLWEWLKFFFSFWEWLTEIILHEWLSNLWLKSFFDWKIFAKSFWWFETGGCSVFSPRPFLPSRRLIAHSDPIYCLQLSVLSIQIQIGIFCSNRISVQTLGNLPLGRKPCAPSYSPDFSPHIDSCQMYLFK